LSLILIFWIIFIRILSDKADALMQVTGKALVLDEIINYIQSLQRQVEV
jgi:hypothetical protein